MSKCNCKPSFREVMNRASYEAATQVITPTKDAVGGKDDGMIAGAVIGIAIAHMAHKFPAMTFGEAIKEIERLHQQHSDQFQKDFAEISERTGMKAQTTRPVSMGDH